MLRFSSLLLTILIFQIVLQQSTEAIKVFPPSEIDESNTEIASNNKYGNIFTAEKIKSEDVKDETGTSVDKDNEDPLAFLNDGSNNTEEISELDDQPEDSDSPSYIQKLSGQLIVPALSAQAKISDVWSSGVTSVQNAGQRAFDMSRDTFNYLRSGVVHLFTRR